MNASKTPYAALHDIDANKPSGSIKIRVKTYAHALKLHEERLEDAAKREAAARGGARATRSSSCSSCAQRSWRRGRCSDVAIVERSWRSCACAWPPGRQRADGHRRRPVVSREDRAAQGIVMLRLGRKTDTGVVRIDA